MFTKILILLVVACTLVDSTEYDRSYDLTDPQAMNFTSRGIFETVGSWIKKATSFVTYPYRKTFDILIQIGLGVTDYGSDKIQQAMKKYDEIKTRYSQNLDNIKNSIIKRAIEEMQGLVDVLAAAANMQTCEEVKQSNQDLADSGKEALDKLQKDLDKAVETQLNNLEKELDKWKVEADNLVRETMAKRKRVVPN